MKKSKIVFILPTLNGGGAERVTINYIRQLEFMNYDITLIIFDKTDYLLSLIPDNVKLINLKTKNTKKSFFKLLTILKEIEPNIVFSTHSRIAFIISLIKYFTKSFIHIARMQSTPSLEKKYSKNRVFKGLAYKYGFKSANIVIAQTEDMKKDAIEIFKIKEKKIEVLYNPLDKNNINSCISSNENPFDKEKISVVASGRITKEKGYKLIISSMKKILQIYPHFELHILGYDEGEKESLIDLAKTLKVDNNIVYHDFVENPYVFYINCDLFILSSYREGFPNAMLENYYLNTPIVATNCIPIVNRLVKNNINGYVCEVGDTEGLTGSIINCIQKIKRKNIHNEEYNGSNINDLFKKLDLK